MKLTPPVPFSSGPSRLAAGLALLFLGACSDSSQDAGAGGLDLFARAPDRVRSQPGTLAPDRDVQWRPWGQFGWEPVTRSERGLPDHVWTTRETAYLNLSAGAPAEREIELTLWAPPGGAGETVTVRLNGISLGQLELAARPAEVRITAPEPGWRAGQNLLELEVEKLYQGPEEGVRVGLALARVTYAASHEPRLRRDGIELEPGNAVAYDLSPLGPAQVTVGGRARGAGELELFLAFAENGEQRAAEPVFELGIPLDDQRIERSLVLPYQAGVLLSLRVGWSSEDPDSSFEIDDLTLREDQPTKRPPIVFVSIDTLAARNLSVYGYPRATTPNLESFAAEGVVFEQCLANAPWTLPSYMSVMTGLYPSSHRLSEKKLPALWESWYLASNRWTLAEALRAAGYETAGFVDNLWITERFGFPQGFDLYDTKAGEIQKVDPEGGILHVVDEAVDWLDDREEALPPFLFLHAFDPHGPYWPQKRFRGRFRDDELFDEELTARARGMTNCFGVVPTYITNGAFPGGEVPESVSVSLLHSLYDEGVASVDAALGELFGELRDLGLYDEALIVVTADHGETMGDGNYLFGHGVLEEEVLRVPLIVRFPGGRHAGRRIAGVVQLVDLYPTLLDFVGVRPRNELHGVSLLDHLDGNPLPERPAFSEGGILDQSMVLADGWKLVERDLGENSARATLLSLPETQERWESALLPVLREREVAERDIEALDRLVARIGREGMTEALWEEIRDRPGFADLTVALRRLYSESRLELYYLPDDPRAVRDVAGENADKVRELLALLRAEQARRERARAEAQPPTEAVALSEQDLDRLRALGYAESE